MTKLMEVSGFTDALSTYCANKDFAGYDPYDALNSPIVRALTFNKKYPRIAAIQFLRRSPVNLRPLLAIREGHNPKALGLFLGGYARLHKLRREAGYDVKIQRLIDLLDLSRSKSNPGNGWGYNFDWQSRAFFVPKYTPTIVNSAFIGHALLDTYQYCGLQRALDLAVPIKDFLLKGLRRTKEGNSFCFSYTPIDNTAVHNANLLGASLLIRLYGHTGENALKQAAMESLSYSMKYQLENGSWYYAEAEMQRWIDSFHTGFNLESIRHFLRADQASEYTDQYNRGVKFYAESFFLPDGSPKYYHDRLYPIDIHSPAEAITFFSGEGDEHAALANKVLDWTLKHMYDERGFFYFRRGRASTNKISYMRWSQAWAFRALTEYEFHRGVNK